MPVVANEPKIDLAALMEAHQAGVWRFLRVLGCDTSLADDLTQETFLAVYRAGFEDRGEKSTRAYLRVVARNAFLKSRRNAGKVITHRQILREVWGPGEGHQTHTVRVHMASLRKKLEADPSQPRWLLTEPGVGYRLREADET